MIIERKINEAELREKIPDYLVVMTKLAVDVEKEILAIGCEFQGNRSMDVQDQEIRDKIKKVITNLLL